MMLCICDVLSAEEVERIRSVAQSLRFVDGRATAGWAARMVKHNDQAESDDSLQAIRRELSQRILQNDLFQIAVRPKELTPVLISRYSQGHSYGTHVDDAL